MTYAACDHERVYFSPSGESEVGKWGFGRVTCLVEGCDWMSDAVREGSSTDIIPPLGNRRWEPGDMPIVPERAPYPKLHYSRKLTDEASLWEVALDDMRLIEWADNLWEKRHDALGEDGAEEHILMREDRVRQELTNFTGALRALILAGEARIASGDGIQPRELELAARLADQAASLGYRTGHRIARCGGGDTVRAQLARSGSGTGLDPV